MKKMSVINKKNMKTLNKLIILFFIVFVFISKGYSQNADPGIGILMAQSSVAQGSTEILRATVGNYGNSTIVSNSLRVTISVGTNVEIIGIAAGSDPRWSQLTLTTGSANTIRLTNTGGGFTSFDIGDILLIVKGNVLSTPTIISGNIVYITANNPLLCGGCAFPPLNASQGNASNPNDNSQTSLAVTVSFPAIVAVVDTPPSVNGITGGTTSSLTLNDTLDGMPVVIGAAPGNVVLSGTTVPAGLTLNADGTVTIAPNTPPGNYILTYKICEVSNTANCDSVSSTIPVSSSTPVEVLFINALTDITTAVNGITGGTTCSLTLNDTLDGMPVVIGAAPGNVVLSGTTVPAGLTLNADGTVTIAPNTPPGNYILTYKICEVSNPLNCASVNSTVVVFTGIETDLCISDNLDFDLFSLLDGTFQRDPTLWSVSGNATINGNLFNPFGLVTGDYIFTYTDATSECLSGTEFTISLNDDCGVCDNLDNVIISKAVTPNGDQDNEYFTIEGIENCGFTVEVEIFNRWGAKIYESKDYQNNWNGFAHSNSVGGSGNVPAGTYYYIINLVGSAFKPYVGYLYVGI